MRYDKSIRGGKPDPRISEDCNYLYSLKEKLVEAVGNYLQSSDVAELANLVEIAYIAAEVQGVNHAAFDIIRARAKVIENNSNHELPLIKTDQSPKRIKPRIKSDLVSPMTSGYGLKIGTGITLTTSPPEIIGPFLDLRNTDMKSIQNELRRSVQDRYDRILMNCPETRAIEHLGAVLATLDGLQPIGFRHIIIQAGTWSAYDSYQHAINSLYGHHPDPFMRHKVESSQGGDGTDKRYRLRITLRGSEPSIWRLIEVNGSMSFAKLHRFIQASMGWQDYHPFIFSLAGARGLAEFQIPIDGDVMDPMQEYKDARYNRIGSWLTPGLHAVYTYDFGDDWIHDIHVEEVLPAMAGAPKAICIDGANNCPPEDVGGLHMFYRTLEILADESDEEYEETKVWVESITEQAPYRADRFDMANANERLLKVK